MSAITEPDQPDAITATPPAELPHVCSFCGKRLFDVRTFVCGQTPGVAICDGCIALCGEIIAEEFEHPAGGEPPTAA